MSKITCATDFGICVDSTLLLDIRFSSNSNVEPMFPDEFPSSTLITISDFAQPGIL